MMAARRGNPIPVWPLNSIVRHRLGKFGKFSNAMSLRLDFAGIFKTRFAIVFCWGPIIASLLLNPGRNGANLHLFSAWRVLLLCLCGCMLVFGAIVGLYPSRSFQFAYKDNWLKVEPHIPTFLFWLLMGCLDLYFTWLWISQFLVADV
jgi:hypothetical protein